MATEPRALLELDNATVLMTTVTSYGEASGHSRYIRIAINDETSGQLVAELNIMSDQLISLLGNSAAKASGRVNVNTHRFGKEHLYEFRPIDVPRGIAGKTGKWGEQPEHPAVLAAIAQAKADGWETTEYRYSHGKHSITCRRWGTDAT